MNAKYKRERAKKAKEEVAVEKIAHNNHVNYSEILNKDIKFTPGKEVHKIETQTKSRNHHLGVAKTQQPKTYGRKKAKKVKADVHSSFHEAGYTKK